MVVVLVIALAGCSGDGDGGSDETPDPAGSAAMPVAERVQVDEGSPLLAGAGGERIDIADVASNGEAALAAATRSTPNGAQAPQLLRTSDGQAWETVELPSELTGSSLAAVASTGDGFLAVGNRAGNQQGNQAGNGVPIAVLSDGETVTGTSELTFANLTDVIQPVRAQAAAVVGERLFAVGLGLRGSMDAPDQVAATLALDYSDDGGESWTSVELPGELAVVDTGAALVEETLAGGTPADVKLIESADALLLTVERRGANGPSSMIWRAEANGEEWTELGAAPDLFDGQSLDLLHPHDDTLLAFTNDGQDAAVWRSDDDGGAFERVESDAWVFGGGGLQSVQQALTLDDGRLVVAGITAGEPEAGRRPADLELWGSTDLTQWERALDDPGLVSAGTHTATGLVSLNGEVVVVGTEERKPSDAEVEAFEADSSTSPSPARHGAAWVVSLENAPAPPAVEIEELAVTGFESDVTINDVIAHGDRLIAAGMVTEDDSVSAAMWTSADGQSWERVTSPALTEDKSNWINAVESTDDGLLAMGQSEVADGGDRLGVWRSADGVEWTQVDLSGDELLEGDAHGLTRVGDELIMVGTDEPRSGRGRAAGIWRSADGGQTWTVVDTTQAPFEANDVEVLTGVTARSDGTLVAVGHAAKVDEWRDDNEFSYFPQPWLLESADGTTWTAVVSPYGEVRFGDFYGVSADGDEVLAYGTAGEAADTPAGEAAVGASGIVRGSGDEWTVAPQLHRHRPTLREVVDSPAGSIAVGIVYRGAGGSDPLIAVERDGELDVVMADGLLAEGDQDAAGAAVLGDRVIVLGTDDSGDESVVAGWAVTATE